MDNSFLQKEIIEGLSYSGLFSRGAIFAYFREYDKIAKINSANLKRHMQSY